MGWNEALNYRRETERGTVTAVNDDGTLDVLIGGREYPYAGVGVPFKNQFSEGDVVTLGFFNRDRNMPQVLDWYHSRAKKPMGSTEEAVGYWRAPNFDFSGNRSTPFGVTYGNMTTSFENRDIIIRRLKTGSSSEYEDITTTTNVTKTRIDAVYSHEGYFYVILQQYWSDSSSWKKYLYKISETGTETSEVDGEDVTSVIWVVSSDILANVKAYTHSYGAFTDFVLNSNDIIITDADYIYLYGYVAFGGGTGTQHFIVQVSTSGTVVCAQCFRSSFWLSTQFYIDDGYMVVPMYGKYTGDSEDTVSGTYQFKVFVYKVDTATLENTDEFNEIEVLTLYPDDYIKYGSTTQGEWNMNAAMATTWRVLFKDNYLTIITTPDPYGMIKPLMYRHSYSIGSAFSSPTSWYGNCEGLTSAETASLTPPDNDNPLTLTKSGYEVNCTGNISYQPAENLDGYYPFNINNLKYLTLKTYKIDTENDSVSLCFEKHPTHIVMGDGFTLDMYHVLSLEDDQLLVNKFSLTFKYILFSGKKESFDSASSDSETVYTSYPSYALDSSTSVLQMLSAEDGSVLWEYDLAEYLTFGSISSSWQYNIGEVATFNQGANIQFSSWDAYWPYHDPDYFHYCKINATITGPEYELNKTFSFNESNSATIPYNLNIYNYFYNFVNIIGDNILIKPPQSFMTYGGQSLTVNVDAGTSETLSRIEEGMAANHHPSYWWSIQEHSYEIGERSKIQDSLITNVNDPLQTARTTMQTFLVVDKTTGEKVSDIASNTYFTNTVSSNNYVTKYECHCVGVGDYLYYLYKQSENVVTVRMRCVDAKTLTEIKVDTLEQDISAVSDEIAIYGLASVNKYLYVWRNKNSSEIFLKRIQ